MRKKTGAETAGSEKRKAQKTDRKRDRWPLWWKLKTAVYILAATAGTLYVGVRLGWSGEAWNCLFIIAALTPVAIDSYLRRYSLRGEKLFQKGRYEDALKAYERYYLYLTRYQWLDRMRNWLLLYYYKDTLRAYALYDMAVCAAFMGDMEKGRRLLRKLQREWPGSRLAGEDFSFWEPENYETFLRDNEAAMCTALSRLLRDGETMELMFYGVVSGKRGSRKCRNQPCFIGYAGGDLLLAALKKPNLEEILWQERFPAEVQWSRRKKLSRGDSESLKLKLQSGEQLKIEFTTRLSAGQYPGQEVNVRKFLEKI